MRSFTFSDGFLKALFKVFVLSQTLKQVFLEICGDLVISMTVINAEQQTGTPFQVRELN